MNLGASYAYLLQPWSVTRHISQERVDYSWFFKTIVCDGGFQGAEPYRHKRVDLKQREAHKQADAKQAESSHPSAVYT